MNANCLSQRLRSATKVSALLLAASSTMLTGATTRGHHPIHSSAASSPSGASPVGRLWGSLLKQCGDTYFYAGSVFDASGMLNNVQINHTKLIEYKGVKFASVPIRITDAERANGLEVRDRITMRAHLYRTDGEQWQDGPDLRPRNMDDMIGRALGSANADMFDMGTNGVMALEVLKFKGSWFARRSSVDMTGSIIGSGDKIYDVDEIIASRHPSYDCAAHQIVTAKSGGKSEAADSSDDDSDK